jgi:hypothetical protein
LVDANFDLETIGAFVGHRSARSTKVYAKVAVEALREVALGDGGAVLTRMTTSPLPSMTALRSGQPAVRDGSNPFAACTIGRRGPAS